MAKNYLTGEDDENTISNPFEIEPVFPQTPLNANGLDIEPVADESAAAAPIPPIAPQAPAAPVTPSLFSQVSNKYQDLQKNGTIGVPSPSIPGLQRNPAAEVSPVQKLLGQIKPTASADIYGKELGDDALKQALEEKNKNLLMNSVLQGGNQIAAAVGGRYGGGINVRNEGLQSQAENAGNKAKDILTQRKALDDKGDAELKHIKLASEKEKVDPTSNASVAARPMYKKMLELAGMQVNIPDNASLSQLESSFGKLDAEKMALIKLKSSELAANRKDKASAKASEAAVKYSKMMGEDLDPNRARTGEMGKNQGRVNAAERIEGLIAQFPDYNIPKIQTRELATAVGALLSSGSQTSVTQVNELVPHTMRGKSNEIAEWVTGNPTGAQQQQFMKLYAETAQREKEIAKKQILDGQLKKAYSTHHKLKELDPDAFYQNLSISTGLDPEEIKKMENSEGFKKGKISFDNHDDKEPQIKKFMDANKITDRNKAIKILKDNGRL